MERQQNSINVGVWAAEWFRRRTEGQLSHNSESGYRNLLFNHIVPKLGDVALGKLTQRRVKGFYADLSAGGLSSRSVWCVHLLLRRVLDEACRAGLLTVNPAAKIQVASTADHEPVRLRPSQITRYLEASKALGVYAILYVGLTNGLRQGELCSLPWAAFDMHNQRLLLKKRWVSLSEAASEALKREHDRHPNSALAFLDPVTNAPYTPHRLYYLHRKILQQAKLPVIGFRDLQRNVKERE